LPFKFSRHPWASAASAALLAGQAFHTPALRDGATGAYLVRCSLRFPLGHLLTTPFSTLADMVTYNSARQDKVLVVYLLLGYWIWRLWRPRPLRRAIRGYAAYLAGVLAFLAWAILVPRPAARLAAHDPRSRAPLPPSASIQAR